MPKIDKVEHEKRIRIVQEWLIEDWPSCDIISQIFTKWQIEQRQAKRYIAEARKRWVSDEQEVLDHKRRRRIESLKKLKRSLQTEYKGTPQGISAILKVEQEIILLENVRPALKIIRSNVDTEDLKIKVTRK